MSTMSQIALVVVLLASSVKASTIYTLTGNNGNAFEDADQAPSYDQLYGYVSSDRGYNGDVDGVSYIPGIGSCYQNTLQFQRSGRLVNGGTSSTLTYIQDPVDNCRVYVCQNGRFLLTQPVMCPSDPQVLPAALQGRGLPCGQCSTYGGQQEVVGNELSEQLLQLLLQSTSTGDSASILTSSGINLPGINSAAVGTPIIAPNGYSSAYRGARIIGGFRLLTDASLLQCLDACRMTSYCLAVDYDRRGRQCFAHGTTTYCSDVTSQTNFDHYQRVPCSVTTTAFGSVINKAVEIQPNFRVNPLATGIAAPICSQCRLIDCLVTCYIDTNCRAVNYDTNATSCYLMNATMACSTLTPANNFLHVTTAPCSGIAINGSNPLYPFSPPPFGVGSSLSQYNNFVQINYKGPTFLPTNWFGFPGSRVLGGTPVAVGISGDQCIVVCQLYSSCTSVNFNSYDGSCWIHTTELTSCGAPIPANNVFHIKKPPTCTYISGTYQPYPLPVIIGSALQ